jgi:hypothetical protein
MNEPHWSLASNPLTRHLPTFKSIDDVSEALRFDPLEGLDIRRMSVMERHEWLVAEKRPLYPTRLSLGTGMTIVNMHRHSLRVRNPTIAQGRRLVHEAVMMAMEGEDFLKRPPAPGACLFIIKGITGTAKSVSAEHALRLLGDQVIHHLDEPAAHWKAATQLSYLYVGMSHDGSRGGLLNGILLAIDAALGTSFAVDLPKMYKTLDRLAGAVISKLHSLYLGILIIDEIQLLNLVNSEQAEKMQLFLLNLANSGIPLVLIGNPLGFTWLNEYTQNLSRALERPPAYFHPHGSIGEDDDEWDSVFIGIRAYYLLDDPPLDEEDCSKVLKRLSGGIPRVGLALWCMAQSEVLLDGGLRLTPKDIERVYLNADFDEIRPLCDGFTNKDPILLLQWAKKDIPVAYYAKIWQKPVPQEQTNATDLADDSPPSQTAGEKDPPKPRARKSAAAKMKAAETRERNKQAEREELSKSLSPEDMRIEGCKQHAMASLAELLKRIEGS